MIKIFSDNNFIKIENYINLPFVLRNNVLTNESLESDKLNHYYCKENLINCTSDAKNPQYSEINIFYNSLHPNKHYINKSDVKIEIEKTKIYILPAEQYNNLFERANKVFISEKRHLGLEDRITIRINDVISENNKVLIKVQPTKYNIQVVTNMIMDLPHSDGKSWRQKADELYHGRFTPLSESPLANNLGIALLILTSENEVIIPLRSRKTAIWGNMWGCSSSFVPKWNSMYEKCRNRKSMTFSTFINSIVYEHVWWELGIEKSEIQIKPLALCREALRGGKPQLFLIGKTGLSKKEIDKRIEIAPHRNEIEKRLFGRIFLNEKNKDKYEKSAELCINTHYVKDFIETKEGKKFIPFSRI